MSYLIITEVYVRVQGIAVCKQHLFTQSQWAIDW